MVARGQQEEEGCCSQRFKAMLHDSKPHYPPQAQGCFCFLLGGTSLCLGGESLETVDKGVGEGLYLYYPHVSLLGQDGRTCL